MIASHTVALSSTHLRAIRRLLKSIPFRRLFPGTRVGAGKDTDTEVETDAGGCAFAVSFEAAPTGRGCDGLIVDDPLKADDARSRDALDACERFYRESLLSRLDHPNRNFVLVVMQRLAANDLAGRLVATGVFNVLSLPLIAVADERLPYSDVAGSHVFERLVDETLNPKRMTKKDLASVKAQITDAAFAAQFQQRPLIVGGNFIKRQWLAHIDTPLTHARMIVQSWDTAITMSEAASFTVCLTWRVDRDRFELVNVFRERVPPEQIGDLAKELVKRHRANVVLVEEANAGYIVGTVLKRLEGLVVEMVRPTTNKIERLEKCLGAFQGSMVLLPQAAPWLYDYESELLGFPNGRHDDQVDATTLFLNWVLPRVNGDIRDPVFRQNPPTIGGPSAGSGVMMRVGRRACLMGSEPSLRPRRGQ